MFGRKETRWEYKIHVTDIYSNDGSVTPNRYIDFETSLNNLGRKGWELASSDFPTKERKSTVMVFKRPKGSHTVAFLKQPRHRI